MILIISIILSFIAGAMLGFLTLLFMMAVGSHNKGLEKKLNREEGNDGIL